MSEQANNPQGNIVTVAPVDGDLGHQDLEAVRKLRDAFAHIKEQLGRVIVGQSEVLKQVLISLFCQGHSIIEGVPV